MVVGVRGTSGVVRAGSQDTAEAVYVLDGEIELTLESQKIQVKAGEIAEIIELEIQIRQLKESEIDAFAVDEIRKSVALQNRIGGNLNIDGILNNESQGGTSDTIPGMPVLFKSSTSSSMITTEVTLNTDGTYTGVYLNSGIPNELESSNGVITECIEECIFWGNFGDFRQLNEFEYSMQILNTQYEGELGESKIVDGVKIITTNPKGFYGEFHLYFPGFTISELPERFLAQMDGSDFGGSAQIDGYGLYDVESEQGFYGLHISTPEELHEQILSGEQLVEFGDYIWRVLSVEDDRALLITESIIDARAYNDEYTDVTWETCTLRKYLNTDFYNTFSASNKQQILNTRVINQDNSVYGTPGGNDTDDKIFLLSIEEANQYFRNDGDRVARLTLQAANKVTTSLGWDRSENDTWNWWLRSPGYYSDGAAEVRDGGYVSGDWDSVDHAYIGVRPAFYINLIP
jgi:hypothetical protein